MTAVTITVSGKAYYNALDPNATDIPREWDLPDRTRVRRYGRGHQFIYEDISVEDALGIAELLVFVGEAWTMGGVDPESAADGRACIAAAERIREQVREQAGER